MNPIRRTTADAGVFQDHACAEAALQQLQQIGFPMDRVSLITQHQSQGDVREDSPAEFSRHETLKHLERGAIEGGEIGGLVGLLMGAATLFLPGIGSVVMLGATPALIGMFAGGFYGSVSGGLLGATINSNIPPQSAKLYAERLKQGQDLVVVEGTDAEIQQAESVLKLQQIQDWVEYHTL